MKYLELKSKYPKAVSSFFTWLGELSLDLSYTFLGKYEDNIYFDLFFNQYFYISHKRYCAISEIKYIEPILKRANIDNNTIWKLVNDGLSGASIIVTDDINEIDSFFKLFEALEILIEDNLI